MNLTAGLLTQFSHCLSMQIGATVPLNNDNSRNFEYQVGIRVNCFFGPHVADRAIYAP
jgi:hypothetical protein